MPDPRPTETSPEPPTVISPEREARRVREAAALRANLTRRKQQARARADDEPEGDAPCR